MTNVSLRDPTAWPHGLRCMECEREIEAWDVIVDRPCVEAVISGVSDADTEVLESVCARCGGLPGMPR